MTTAGYQNLLHEEPEPGIHLLTMNRPKALNALNSATLAELACAITGLAADASARAVLITGAGAKAFVAGADIGEMQTLTPEAARTFSSKATRLFLELEALPMPVLALVNGYALGGGCELALACDWIVAADNAVFGQPEVGLGIPPGFGGSQRLPRRIAPGKALELLVTGRQVKADEAVAIGLANEVVAADALRARGIELALLIASKGPVAVRLVKEAWRRGQSLDLAQACAIESDLFALAFATADQSEGMRAFLEKRAPRFIGG
ncbi:MAG: enoyl-CoA hydratase/isomerase family protein [Proteobacteria bacterium]|nr:enoyl-CoA hydratase/isomerase family protein [Burkholderiales bacterium]